MIQGIHHIGLRGPHPAAELAPYAAFFGTAVETDGANALVRAPNGFLLAEPGEAPPRAASVHATGLAHPCIQSSREDEARARLEAQGVTLLASPVALGTGFRYCYARDAAGRLLEFEVAPFLKDETLPGWLTHVAFVSPDAERLSAFYGALLGRKLSHGPRVSGNAGVDQIAQMQGLDVEPTWILGLNLMLEIWRYHAPALVDPAERQCAYTHLAWQCADPHATQAQALSLGATADEPQLLWGQSHPAVRDLDGNRLVFLRPQDAGWTIEQGLAAPDFVQRVLPARDAYLARLKAEKAEKAAAALGAERTRSSVASPAAAAAVKPARTHRWPAIWAFGFVGLPLATLSLPLAIYLAPFYAGEVGLSLALLGTAMLFGRIVDFAVDPFIGHASDRLRTRWGRRKPFVVVGAAVVLLATHFLFRPPPGVSLAYFVGWLGVMYIGNSLIGVAHRAWGAELSTHYDERTHISTVRQTFATAGFIVSTVVPALVLSQAGAKPSAVLASLSTLLWVLLPIAVLAGLLLTPDRATHEAHTAQPFKLREAWHAVRRNGSLRTILLVLGIGFCAETFRQTITVFYARDVIGVKNLGMVYVYFFVAAFVAMPAWRAIARRYGKHRALTAGITLSILANLGLFTLGRGDTTAFMALFIIKGCCFGAMEMVPAAMLADATDVDTALTHRQRAGLIFALAGVVTNVGQALGQFLSLQALSLIGYKAAGETDPGALTSLSYLYAVLPSAIMAVALILALRYRLTAERHAKLRRALERRAAALQPQA